MTKQFGTLFGNDQLGLTLPAANRSENSSLLLSTITTTPSIPIVFADAPKPDSKLPPQTHVVGNFPEISLNIDAGPQTFDKEADVRSSSASKTDSRVTGALNSEITNGTANGIATTPKIVTVDLNDFVLTAEFLGDLLKEKGGLKSLMDLLNDPVARKSLIPGFGA